MKIKMRDVKRYAVLIEYGKVTNEMAQREYGRSSDLLDEAKVLREKAFEFMETGKALADKTDQIIEKANEIREKYEFSGMVYEFDETYEGYIGELDE